MDPGRQPQSTPPRPERKLFLSSASGLPIIFRQEMSRKQGPRACTSSTPGSRGAWEEWPHGGRSGGNSSYVPDIAKDSRQPRLRYKLAPSLAPDHWSASWGQCCRGPQESIYPVHCGPEASEGLGIACRELRSRDGRARLCPGEGLVGRAMWWEDLWGDERCPSSRGKQQDHLNPGRTSAWRPSYSSAKGSGI